MTIPGRVFGFGFWVCFGFWVLDSGFSKASLNAAPAKKKGAPSIPWTQKVEDAKKQSGGAKPIAVFLTQEGSPLDRQFEKVFSEDDRVEGLAPHLAWLKIAVGTGEYQHWFDKECGSKVEGTPSLIFLNPKGENADPAYAALPTVTSADPDDIVPALRAAVAAAKGKVPDADKAAAGRVLAEARKAPSPAEAIRKYREGLRLVDGWPSEEASAEQAREAIEKLLKDGSAEMLRIQREIRDADALKAAYQKVQTDYAGTSLAWWAAQELARVQ